MYDITKSFAQIEQELIGSMIRNLDRHQAQELKEGLNWSQWQVEQLRALDDYKRYYNTHYNQEFESINAQITDIISKSYNKGALDAEKEILEAISKGYTTKYNGDNPFFNTNKPKLDALIKAIQNDMKKAEHAILRKSNDEYRQTIFNAQVYANSGAGTYTQAVDMATKSFLSKGIACIEYKNGSRHTVEDYSKMAIKTANKRAYLMGEAQKRDEWGINTVIVHGRGVACPLCLPFLGEVLIDDVFGSVAKDDGKYPLLSEAMAEGLYHPNCSDSHSTYFEGITEKPDKTYTKEEAEEIKESYKNGQYQKYVDRQIDKYTRLSQGSLDDENKAKYEAKRKQWANLSKYNHNYKLDKEQYIKYKAILGKDLPTGVENFRNFKYNNKEEWDRLKREINTINTINGKDWSQSYKDKVKSIYYEFRQYGIELSSHAAQRFIERNIDKNSNSVFTKKDIVGMLNKKPNYLQEDSRIVNFENEIAIIRNSKNNEVVSIVNRKNIKKGWVQID